MLSLVLNSFILIHSLLLLFSSLILVLCTCYIYLYRAIYVFISLISFLSFVTYFNSLFDHLVIYCFLYFLSSVVIFRFIFPCLPLNFPAGLPSVCSLSHCYFVPCYSLYFDPSFGEILKFSTWYFYPLYFLDLNILNESLILPSDLNFAGLLSFSRSTFFSSSLILSVLFLLAAGLFFG
jgi:hypothetical protein